MALTAEVGCSPAEEHCRAAAPEALEHHSLVSVNWAAFLGPLCAFLADVFAQRLPAVIAALLVASEEWRVAPNTHVEDEFVIGELDGILEVLARRVPYMVLLVLEMVTGDGDPNESVNCASQ
jgi:hypothetical protein